MKKTFAIIYLSRPVGYERVYLPLCKVADTPFHIQGDDLDPKTTSLVNIHT